MPTQMQYSWHPDFGEWQNGMISSKYDNDENLNGLPNTKFLKHFLVSQKPYQCKLIKICLGDTQFIKSKLKMLEKHLDLIVVVYSCFTLCMKSVRREFLRWLLYENGTVYSLQFLNFVRWLCDVWNMLKRFLYAIYIFQPQNLYEHANCDDDKYKMSQWIEIKEPERECKMNQRK